MSRRARAAGFAVLAILCAVASAAIASGYRDSVDAQLGDLREVVVVTRPLPAGEPLDRAEVRGALAVREVPVRFLPPDALIDPAEAMGRRPAASVPAGSYLLVSHFRSSAARRPSGPRLATGLQPVEITVTGAGAVASLSQSEATRVDVVVAGEPITGDGARVRVAAAGVRLLAIEPASPEDGVAVGGGRLERHAGVDAKAGAGADRGRELRPRDPADPGGPMTSVDHVERLAGDLRAKLIERRRALAVAGEVDVPALPAAIRELVEAEAALLSAERREELAARVLRDTVGLGPLEELLRDPEVEEVLVNGPGEVWVERRGRMKLTGIGFADEEELRDVIERILGPIGRRVDELSPIADGRLPDGSRVNVIIPPLAVDGPSVSIRRFAGIRPDADELVRRGTLDEGLLGLLRDAVRDGRNLLISGGTGSGKTTVLNALSGFIGASERVITIEDAAELSLRQPHVVRLESRPAGIEGSGEVVDP